MLHRRWKKIAVVAGGGSLPIRLAEACEATQAPFYIIRLTGLTDDGLDIFPGEDCAIAEVGRLFRIIRDQQCDSVVLAGVVQRPDFSSLKPDWRGAALLPKLTAAAIKGDGAILATLVDAFESEGFRVIGAEEVLENGTPTSGAMGTHTPSPTDLKDIAKAAQLIRAIGPYDVGQGAIVSDGQVLAIEAAEGTDQMLLRCANLRHLLPLPKRSGVLVKIPKPGQELRVDLPTIGPQTIQYAAEAGLTGIAVAEGAAIMIDRTALIQAADRQELFVYGFRENDPSPS